LSLWNKIKYLNLNIFITRGCKPLIFQTQIIWSNRIHESNEITAYFSVSTRSPGSSGIIWTTGWFHFRNLLNRLTESAGPGWEQSPLFHWICRSRVGTISTIQLNLQVQGGNNLYHSTESAGPGWEQSPLFIWICRSRVGTISTIHLNLQVQGGNNLYHSTESAGPEGGNNLHHSMSKR